MREALHKIDDMCVIENAAQRAGFIVGFEYARRLFTKGGDQ
jgi:hypothetical protein